MEEIIKKINEFSKLARERNLPKKKLRKGKI